MRKLLIAGLLIPVLAACGSPKITEHTDLFGNVWRIDCSDRSYLIENSTDEDWGVGPMQTVNERVKKLKAKGVDAFTIGFGRGYASGLIDEACEADQ